MSKYAGRNRAYTSLAADISDIADLTDKRLTALMQQSLQDVINEALLSDDKGGRMRVDTGFLRLSGQASLTGMPTGPVRGDNKAKHAYDDGNGINPTITASLSKLQFGSIFYFGWTAEYARYRELYDGFLEGALRNWGRIVAFNADTIRQRIKK